jgi:hypothetical protein
MSDDSKYISHYHSPPLPCHIPLPTHLLLVSREVRDEDMLLPKGLVELGGVVQPDLAHGAGAKGERHENVDEEATKPAGKTVFFKFLAKWTSGQCFAALGQLLIHFHILRLPPASSHPPEGNRGHDSCNDSVGHRVSDQGDRGGDVIEV